MRKTQYTHQSMLYFDIYYLILVVPAMLISLFAQMAVKSTFARYSQILTERNISGKDMAEYLLNRSGLSNVKVEGIRGSLTDHYDPSSKVLRLSEDVFKKVSVSAVGVAAHEMGHALQDKEHYAPLVLRSTLVPIANLGSQAGPWLAIAGIGFGLQFLTNIGIILFAGAVLFYLVTLPVEIDASRRALRLLHESSFLSSEELYGVQKVLTAAAFTYIASALVAIASLVRLILLSQNRRRR